MKIPKIIHYCWFGPGFMPRQHKDMVRQWKKLMPEYTFMKWDDSNFDIHCCLYTECAYAEGKYAFVSDVARCKALADYGGIYLDTDVSIYRRLDPYLQHAFFSANEIHQDYYTLGKDSLDENFLPKTKEEQKRLLLDRYYLLGLYDAYKAVRRAVVKPIKKLLNK